MRNSLTILATLSLLSGPAFAGDLVSLNPRVILTKGVLTVGDLFQPAGSYAEHVLAPAPKAGSELTLTRADLQRVADTFRLDWHSDDADLTVTVERDALVVTPTMLSEALAKSDLTNLVDADADITVQSPADGVAVMGQEMPDIAFEDLRYDALKQSFTATALMKRDGKLLAKSQISGLAARMIDVPVLTSSVERGVSIGKSDITTVRLPAKDVKASVVSSVADVVGMIAKRTLSAQQPLAKSDLVAPLMVRRNEIVIVTYKNGSIVLSTRARAMANGTKGETVQLQNPASKKIIEAVVTGPQQATITMDSALAING